EREAGAAAAARVAVVERVGRAAHEVDAERAAVQVEDEGDDDRRDADVARVDGDAAAAGAFDPQRRVGPSRADADTEPAAEVALEVGLDAGARRGGEARRGRRRAELGADDRGLPDEGSEDDRSGGEADA